MRYRRFQPSKCRAIHGTSFRGAGELRLARSQLPHPSVRCCGLLMPRNGNVGLVGMGGRSKYGDMDVAPSGITSMTSDEAYHMCGVQLMESWLPFIYMSHCHELCLFFFNNQLLFLYASFSVLLLHLSFIPARNVFQDRYQRNCQATNLHHLQGLEVDLSLHFSTYAILLPSRLPLFLPHRLQRPKRFYRYYTTIRINLTN